MPGMSWAKKTGLDSYRGNLDKISQGCKRRSGQIYANNIIISSSVWNHVSLQLILCIA